MTVKRHHTMYAIDSVRDAIKALGGVQQIVSRRPVKRSAVGMWVTYGYVTGGHQVPVLVSLEALGYARKDINPEVFDLRSWDDAMIARLKPRRRANGAGRRKH